MPPIDADLISSKEQELREALLLILDHVDYTVLGRNCSPTEMVGAVLPVPVIHRARKALVP